MKMPERTTQFNEEETRMIVGFVIDNFPVEVMNEWLGGMSAADFVLHILEKAKPPSVNFNFTSSGTVTG